MIGVEFESRFAWLQSLDSYPLPLYCLPIHSFNEQWPYTYYILGTVLGPVDSGMHKILNLGGPNIYIKWVHWPSQGLTLWSRPQ